MSLTNSTLKKQLVTGVGDIDLSIFNFKYIIAKHLSEEQGAVIYGKLVVANTAIIEAQSLISELP